MKLKSILAILTSSSLLALSLKGQEAFEIVWNTEGYTPPAALSATVTGPGSSLITGVSLSRGPDISDASLTNGFSSNGWDSTTGGEYFQFGLTVNPGYAADLSGLIIGLRASNTGPRDLRLMISSDGFATAGTEVLQFGPLPGGTGGAAFSNQSFDAGDLSLTNLTGTVTFRIVKASEVSANGGSIGSTGTFALARFSGSSGLVPSGFTGTVSVIPEPQTVAMFSGVLVIVVTLIARRRTRG